MEIKTKILIVDDREENLIALEKVLIDFDVEFVRAFSGNEALQLMIEHEYALVLMDVQMPDMDGFETVQIMMQDKELENTPVIFISAIYKEENYTITGIERGAIDFIVKPIIPQILIGKVKIFINIYEHRKNLELMNEKLNKNEKQLQWELLVNKTLAALAHQLISPELSIKEMAVSIFEASRELTGSDHGFVSEIDRKTRDNIGHTISAMMGCSSAINEPYKCLTFASGENGINPKMWGHALNKGEPFLTNDFTEQFMSSGLPEGHVPMKNFLSMPVKYNNEVIGQIALTNTPSEYTEQHLLAIQKVADLYALGIHRKREEMDRKIMEDEIRQKEKMQVIGQLAGGIAHDFNNQLGMIIGNAELSLISLSDNEINKPVIKRLKSIIKVSSRAAELTGQLLAYARKGYNIKKEINPDKIIYDVISVLERTIDKKISIIHELCFSGLSIIGDPTQIYSAILNIGINARDAMPHGGKISFKTSEENVDNLSEFNNPGKLTSGKYLKIEISDTGNGIKKEILDQIFDPFFTTKKIGEGTGMGLSAVQGIVKIHNGIINVSTIEGEGTTFTIHFPSVEKTGINNNTDDSVVHDSQLKGTVILAEDEEVLCKIEEAMLMELGLNVLTAADGREAVNLFKKHKGEIDLVILDLVMPQMDGKETLKRIQKINPETKILILTGSTTENPENFIKKHGVAGIIEKPFIYNDLHDIISAILKN